MLVEAVSICRQPIGFVVCKRSRISVWLKDNVKLRRIERVVVGFDEYMNVVTDDSEEVHQKTKRRKTIGNIFQEMDLETRVTQKSIDVELVTSKFMLPSAKMANTILRENLSQSRMLQRHKRLLDKQARKELLLVDRSKKNFLFSQTRKQGKWRREDEVRVNCLNLPTIKAENLQRPNSMKVLYSSPNYDAVKPNQQIYVPLRKTMGINTKRTEIVNHNTQLAVTHLPPIVNISKAVLSKYDRYRGTSFMTPTLLSTDARFTKCAQLLETLGVTEPNQGAEILTKNDTTRQGFYLSCPTKSSEEATKTMLQSLNTTRSKSSVTFAPTTSVKMSTTGF
ncbi:uncharacterized protein [Watersipora subatra]|uniref:uncharacterized protein n=1 Tax=Watersipora subatra TaxID=2589382 RepID=UPI00355B72DB